MNNSEPVTTDPALAIGRELIDALDRNDVDHMMALCDRTGTWWVDTGRDRARGIAKAKPGDDRPPPLRGEMTLADKLESLRGLSTRYPDGCRQRQWHSFGNADSALVEVEGDAVSNTGALYRNRYAFVIRTGGGKVVSVREYYDTAHVAVVYTGRNLDHRTVAPKPLPVSIDASSDQVQLALDFVGALAAASPDLMIALAAPNATWWADSGPNREHGRFDVEPQAGDRVAVVGMANLADRAQLTSGLLATFDDGWMIVPTNVVDGDASVAVEASGHGVRSDGSTYQNRYCFVFDVVDGKIGAVREYRDTLHAADFFDFPS